MKLIHTMDPVQFDLYASSKYREKATDARRRELEFNLTFSEFRRILSKKRCEYTGITLTLPVLDGGKQKKTDLTIERIDNKKVMYGVIVLLYAMRQTISNRYLKTQVHHLIFPTL